MKKEHIAKLRITDTLTDLYYDGIGKKHVVKALNSILEDIKKGAMS